VWSRRTKNEGIIDVSITHCLIRTGKLDAEIDSSIFLRKSIHPITIPIPPINLHLSFKFFLVQSENTVRYTINYYLKILQRSSGTSAINKFSYIDYCS
jgi:hypothetical protein